VLEPDAVLEGSAHPDEHLAYESLHPLLHLRVAHQQTVQLITLFNQSIYVE
jgi:hypothetical protein